MENPKEKVLAAAAFLKKQLPARPEIGFLTGTGLEKSTGSITISASFDYTEIPYFPVSTVQSHRGRLILGTLSGRTILALQGRFHLYEGYMPGEVTFPVRVMQTLGVKKLIITNAAGGINQQFIQGDIMIIADHVNLTGKNPLTGPNENSWGERFPDMGAAYSERLINLAKKAAASVGVSVKKGVYAGLPGPSLETPAEIRFLKTIGCDAVGFSTVLEVIAAIHAGMEILALAAITNVHNPDHPEKTSVEKIIKVAEKTAVRMDDITAELVRQIDV